MTTPSHTQSIWDAAYLLAIGFDLLGVEPDVSKDFTVNFLLSHEEKDFSTEMKNLNKGKALVDPKKFQSCYLRLRGLIEPHRRRKLQSKRTQDDEQEKGSS